MRKMQQQRAASPWHQGWMQGFAAASVLTMVVVGLPGCRAIEDRFNLVPKPPSAEVERLAQATTMTPLAQRLFYRQSPTVENRSTFLAQCQSSEDAIVLGCYLELKQVDSEGRLLPHRFLDGKIVIQLIDDPQFAGTMEVAAAHEMLHAAYAQLDESQRVELGQQLQAALAQVENKRLLRVLADYETGDVERYYHELHAHLGTELKTFSNPALETHYQRYFRDRQRVVAFAERSVRVLTEFDQQAEALELEIEDFELQLTQSQTELEDNANHLREASRDLDFQKDALDRLRVDAEAALRAGDFRADQLVDQFKRDQLTFNHEVELHNAQVQQHEQRIERFKTKRQDYQEAVESYNQIAQETRKVLEGLKGPVLPAEKVVGDDLAQP